MLRHQILIAGTLSVASILSFSPIAKANTLVKVTIENLAPSDGTVLTPLWVGFHDGTFDTFNVGGKASPALESLAEDGITDGLKNDFVSGSAGVVEATITGVGLGPGTPPVIPPNSSASQTFTVDENLATSGYFSYASMVVPSNDAFIGNDNPSAFKIFDDQGNFLGADFIVRGDRVWDAGTEENDEIPANTALLGQTAPNTGVTTDEAIVAHPGFIPGGNILTAFAGADFTQPNYEVARITVEQVPEPTTIAGSLLIISGLLNYKKIKPRQKV